MKLHAALVLNITYWAIYEPRRIHSVVDVFFFSFFSFFFLMKLYYNTDTLRTILKQVYYKKQKTKNYTTYNTIACATTYNAKTNTTYNYLHYNCKTIHTHNTRTHTWAKNRVLSA